MKCFSSKAIAGAAVLLSMTMAQTLMAQTVDVGTGKSWQQQVVAPYVDSCLTEVPDLVQVAKQTGVNRFNLGFIVADANGNPSWGGKYPMLASPVDGQIKAIRDAGGDVMVSFGGVAGTPLHVAIKDETKLANALMDVVDDYELTAIDFDLEGQGLTDLESARRLVRSLVAVQKQYPNIDIWLTLPVGKDGLTQDGKALVNYAVKRGLDFEGVNLMAMNYGTEVAQSSDMGDQAIKAAEATVVQLDVIYKGNNKNVSTAAIWQKIGLTPMIGVNNTGQLFTLQDAQQVAELSKQKDLGYVGYWSLTRDKQGSLGAVSPNYSGVNQEPLAYTKVFAGGSYQVVGKEIKVYPISESDLTETSAYFEWEATTDVKTYVIYRDGTEIARTESLEYTDSKLKAGTRYYYVVEGLDKDGKLIARSQSFSVTTKGQSVGPVVPPVVPVPSGTWQPGVTYKVGDSVTYNQKTYICVQPHTALGDWQPSNVPALWNVLPGGKVDANGTPWEAQVKYKAADVVTFNGKTYSCIQPHTSLQGWDPASTPALWGEFKK